MAVRGLRSGAGPIVLILCSLGVLLVGGRLAVPAPAGAANAAPVVPAVEVLPTTEPTPPSTPTPVSTPSPSPSPTPAPTSTPRPTQTPLVARATLDRGLVTAGRAETGVVALTMDAGGRDPGRTAEVLDTLARFGIRATMYLTGEWCEANPALVARMAAEGHELGNHTYDHPHLTLVSDEEMLSQLGRTEAVIKRFAGREPVKDVRPPFGDYDARVLAVLGAHGYRVVYWTVDAADWRPEVSAAEIVARVGGRTAAGDVVVMHVYAPKAAEALPGILEAWRARGLRAGTLAEALGR